ncbi:MAG: hypothetical protein V4667_08215 [Bacteroidota bacterium]
MKALQRIRIILFCIMVFGAFANFAQNQWGLTVIDICVFFMIFTFFAESYLLNKLRIKQKQNVKYNKFQNIILVAFTFLFIASFLVGNSNSLINSIMLNSWVICILLLLINCIIELAIELLNKKNTFINGVAESNLLGLFYVGLFFKIMHWPGASVTLVLSVFFLFLFYSFSTIVFFKQNKNKGKQIVYLLSFGSIATILLGVAFIIATQHWSRIGSGILYYTALLITLVMIAGTIKWKYSFNGEKINILKAMQLLKTKIVLIYMVAFIYCTYKTFTIWGLAPRYYKQDEPSSCDLLYLEGNLKESGVVSTAFYNFRENAEKNGFLR